MHKQNPLNLKQIQLRFLLTATTSISDILSRIGLFEYFFKENNNGLFVGPVVIYSKDEIENSYKQKINNDQLLAGLRIGYRIMPFKKQRENLNGFYFTPFIAPFYSFANDVAFTNGNSFEYKQFQLWGGIHLGVSPR
jgi:hypothetical protein